MTDSNESHIRKLKDWNGILLFVIAVLLVIIYIHPNHTVMPTDEYKSKIEKTQRDAREEQMNALFGSQAALENTMVCAMWGLWSNNRLNASLKQWLEATYDPYRLETTCTGDGLD